jgi:hypothetical protein
VKGFCGEAPVFKSTRPSAWVQLQVFRIGNPEPVVGRPGTLAPVVCESLAEVVQRGRSITPRS